MDAVSPRFGDQVVDAAGAASVLGRHVQGQLLEFRDRILDRGVIFAAADVLVRFAVDEKAIEIFANAVDDGVVASFHIDAGHVHGAWGQLHQVIDVAAVQGQVADLCRVHRGGQFRIFRVDLRSFAGDFDYFGSLADLKLEVDVRDGACVRGYAIVGNRLEAWSLDRDFIDTWRDLFHRVITGGICGGGEALAGSRIGGCHLGVCDRCASWVEHGSGKLGELYLSGCAEA